MTTANKAELGGELNSNAPTESESLVTNSRSTITALELKKTLQSTGRGSLLLVDVREPNEYRDWKIQDSVNMPLDELLTPEGLNGLPRKKEIVTICAHGMRSASAARSLRRAGFKAAHLAQGLVGWSKIYDTARVSAPRISPQILQIRRMGKGCVSYMVCNEGMAAVVDPSAHANEFVSMAKDEGAKIQHVIDTHLHADHVSGARVLSRETGATLHLNPLEGYFFDDFAPVRDGDTIDLGGMLIEAFHTPGHTQGSTSFLVARKYLLTGDILFLEGIARPDLHDKSRSFASHLFHTYHAIFPRFPDEVVILPAHFSQEVSFEFGRPLMSTLGELRKKLSIMNATKDEFLNYVREVPQKPPNYAKIISMNREDSAYRERVVEQLEEGPNRCALKAN